MTTVTNMIDTARDTVGSIPAEEMRVVITAVPGLSDVIQTANLAGRRAAELYDAGELTEAYHYADTASELASAALVLALEALANREAAS